MELDQHFQDGLAQLLVAARREDREDLNECAAYVAKRLEGFGVPEFADRLRRIVGAHDFIDGVWAPDRWANDWFRLDDGDRLFSIFETKQSAESRKALAPPSILTSEQHAMIEEILNVGKSRLKKLEPRSTCMLTYGTAVEEPYYMALYIARQLQLKCTWVEFLDSYEPGIGRWSGQLHWLREYAAKEPRVWILRKLENVCNTLLARDGWRIEELKCVRNKFLKDLSMLDTPAVVVACTNFEMKLDAEAWEPFSYRMELNAAEPNPWLLAFRSFLLDDSDGVRKAMASLPAEFQAKPPPSTDSTN